MACKANLTIYQGDDYAANIIVTEEDGVTPADLTGYTTQAQLRTDYTDTSPNGVAQFTAVVNANIITIALDHTVTAALGNVYYLWDVQLIDPTGWITTILGGVVNVTREITKYMPLAAPFANARVIQ